MLYYLGAPVWISYVIFIFDYVILNIVIRCFTLKKLMPFSFRQFLLDVLLPCLVVAVLSFIVPLIICYNVPPGLLRFFINVPIAVFWTGLCCFLFGLTKGERLFFKDKVECLICKYIKNDSHFRKNKSSGCNERI